MSLETIFRVKILKFFEADADKDPESGNFFDPKSWIRDGISSNPVSGKNIPDPQHWLRHQPQKSELSAFPLLWGKQKYMKSLPAKNKDRICDN